MTFDGVAQTTSIVSELPFTYEDIDQKTWINGAVAAGVPADYAGMLRWLTGPIIQGEGPTPTGDIETVIGRPATSFEALAPRDAAILTKQEGK
jgi:hypothetical protein